MFQDTFAKWFDFGTSEKRINSGLKVIKVVNFCSPNYVYAFSIGFT